MIISTVTQNISSKVRTDSFVAGNLNPHHRMNFHDCIKKISPAINTGKRAHFRNHKGSYYYAMPYFWKNMYVPVRIEVMCIIDYFLAETPPGKSPWTKENILSIIHFFLLTKYPKSIYDIW